ncbi:SDR family NAD(P)-dependent oxidoreductase [Cryptosporangium sp. NPDC048952]|uniref:SDR family NAD(P)-dependent oxidoreductase n=1 Tax=Cryptosporangium sp. NPDC048952 TaxID=3363961 RepID=UPI0037225EC2
METTNTPLPLAGRRALVTGGSRGIGRTVALALAAAGADVAITFSRNTVAAATTVDDITKLGRVGRSYQGSVAIVADVHWQVEAAVRDLGGLDLVVSNAGMSGSGDPVVETDPGELERMLRVHAFGPHHVAQAALPHLRRNDRSDLVFVSSIATDTYPANRAPHSMGKAAVEALARTVAKEERSRGVHVNVVAPGLVATEMGLDFARLSDMDLREREERSPFRHMCTPEEIAEGVLFLVTASYVNDVRLVVDGGTF